jgi:catechol 2,3-dioxygenase-like lactoylglutathione lyase family enzyme
MRPIEQVVETAAYADDLARAEAFYSGLLRLPVAAREEGRHVFFRVGDGMLLVFRPEATLAEGGDLPPHGATGPTHLALGIVTEDYEAWRSHLRTNGVEVEREVRWPRGGRSMYFRDPAGNSVELVTRGIWGLPGGW